MQGRSSAGEQTSLRQQNDDFFCFEEPEKAGGIVAVFPDEGDFPFSHLITELVEREKHFDTLKRLIKRSIAAGLATEEEIEMLDDVHINFFQEQISGGCFLMKEKIVISEPLWGINQSFGGLEFLFRCVAYDCRPVRLYLLVRNVSTMEILASKILPPYVKGPLYLTVYRGYLLLLAAGSIYLVALSDRAQNKEQLFSICLIPQAPVDQNELNSYLVDDCTAVPSIVKIGSDRISRYGNIILQGETQEDSSFHLEELFSFADPDLTYARAIIYCTPNSSFGNPAGTIDSKGRIWFLNRNREMVILSPDFLLLAKLKVASNVLFACHGDEVWVGTVAGKEMFSRLIYLERRTS